MNICSLVLIAVNVVRFNSTNRPCTNAALLPYHLLLKIFHLSVAFLLLVRRENVSFPLLARETKKTLKGRRWWNRKHKEAATSISDNGPIWIYRLPYWTSLTSEPLQFFAPGLSFRRPSFCTRQISSKKHRTLLIHLGESF